MKIALTNDMTYIEGVHDRCTIIYVAIIEIIVATFGLSR